MLEEMRGDTCELANRENPASKQSHPHGVSDDHQFKDEEIIGYSGRIVDSLFTNCPEMHVFSTHRQA